MKSFHRSLAGKFTICTGLVLLVIIVMFASITIESHRQDSFKYAEEDVRTLSEIILQMTYHQMHQGDLSMVYKIMDEISSHEKIARIRLFDENGTLRYSTRRSELFGSGDAPADECLHCHASNTERAHPSPSDARRLLTDCNGNEFLSFSTQIPNQPSCSTAACHVHARNSSILGVLEVHASMQNFAAHANTYRLNVIAFAASLMLILVVSLVWLTNDLVVRPVQSLLLHSRKVAKMELNDRVVLKSSDEIGELAWEFNEMTDRLRQAQADYKQLTETLEAKVEARTEEVAAMHSQLTRSEKLASLGQLVAGIAHEINNPLSGILMFASLIAEDHTLSKTQREDAQTIVRESQRCAEIVKRLLEFSRNSIPHKKFVTLCEIMDNTVALLEHQAFLNNIEIIRHCDALPPRVEVDPGQIEQVFINIMVNACQAMPQGGRVTVRSHANYARNIIVTTIEDTGQGIPPENLAKIFDPFFTTKDHELNGLTGTGLGLSVTYGIVQNHGGRIDVVSQVGKGTIFTVELPLTGEPPLLV